MQVLLNLFLKMFMFFLPYIARIYFEGVFFCLRNSNFMHVNSLNNLYPVLRDRLGHAAGQKRI